MYYSDIDKKIKYEQIYFLFMCNVEKRNKLKFSLKEN